MSKIRFFALGGQNELGKNMFVLEIGEKIFVFEAGASSPLSQSLEYDQVLPSIKYLLENLERVQGIFLSHFHDSVCGALLKIIGEAKIPFYGSKFTIEAIEKRYLVSITTEEKANTDLRAVGENEVINFNGIDIQFFSVTNNVPGTIGFAVKVDISEENDGSDIKNIVFFPECNFDENLDRGYKNNYKALAKIAEEGVLVFLSPSTGANRPGHITTDEKLDMSLQKVMSQEGRLYVLMHANNVAGMIKVIKAAASQERHVTIIGGKARILVELAAEQGYSVLPDNGLYMCKSELDDEKRNSDNTVVIISGEGSEPLVALQKIALREDKHYKLLNTDNVVILTEFQKKYEKILAKTWDMIWTTNSNLIDFDAKLIPKTIAGSEDIKLMYSMLNPKYVIPINGETVMLKDQRRIALDYGYDENHVIEIDNCQIIEFNNGEYAGIVDSFKPEETYFSSILDTEISNQVAAEKNAMAKEGFIVISGMINLKEREVYGDIQTVFYGFLPKISKDIIIQKMKDIFISEVEKHLKMKKIDYKTLRGDIREKISDMIKEDVKKKPVIITVIVDISN